MVSAKDATGKSIQIKWKKMGDNQVKVYNKADSAVRMKLTVTPKEPLENKDGTRLHSMLHVH